MAFSVPCFLLSITHIGLEKLRFSASTTNASSKWKRRTWSKRVCRYRITFRFFQHFASQTMSGFLPTDTFYRDAGNGPESWTAKAPPSCARRIARLYINPQEKSFVSVPQRCHSSHTYGQMPRKMAESGEFGVKTLHLWMDLVRRMIHKISFNRYLLPRKSMRECTGHSVGQNGYCGKTRAVSPKRTQAGNN